VWTEARSALERYFGYPDFRPGQGEAIRSALSGRDTLVVMPTGGGKSLCYQIPALVLPGLTLVVSPLIALMLDQVSALERRGIAAALINSTLSSEEIQERLGRAACGGLKLLYVAPERFGSLAFQRALQRMDVSMVAVDEAHCVCQWGHDFRPSYLKLRRVWSKIGDPRILALTATATPEVRRDIVKELGLRKARVLVHGFDRPNLRWIVRREDKLASKCRTLIRLLSISGESAVVYASTRKMAEAATELLRGAGVGAAAYHAGMTREQRVWVQEAWTSGAVPVVVATNAFGMGIDKEDVRRVIHFQMPGSLEAYYQEAGRAGRDGEAADCILLHAYGDRFTHEFFIRTSYPPRKVLLSTYRALRDAAASFGGPVMPARFAHRVAGMKSPREIYSALRILTDSGAVENAAARRGLIVRWVASASDLDELLVNGAGSGVDEPVERSLLEGLARASARGARRTFRVSRRELARWCGGDFRSARLGLERLQASGLLGWREDGVNAGYRPANPSLRPDDLPVDWARVSELRAMEIRKLRRMEKYAFQRGCRRRYLLGYFGESGRVACDSCDRCAPEVARLPGLAG
jgi:ATP-dependent DNA helicase RecQ